ncbi:MAG: hypothetical protein AAGE01_01230 [Pseudomonadota bacterium]
MIIFLAVMLADVILLDLFNTFGMPTSTTVSIVFELLGAAVVVALLIVMRDPDATSIAPFINSASALAIVTGIVLSVGVAFTVGAVVQFVSRILFGFNGSYGAALLLGWSAIALAAISFFLFIKGLAGAAFVPENMVAFMRNHVAATLGILSVSWLIVVAVLRRLGFEPLKLVVLAGTFALAMAFASNDLVNFIGVPLAGLASWQAWQGTNVAPDALTMEFLATPVRGQTHYLVVAGVVMIVTLWLSAKARSVTETEVNLGRQDDGAERFTPGPVSQGIVRAALVLFKTVPKLVPAGMSERVERQFVRDDDPWKDAPAFDLIRASVNLTIAAILIAIATSLKLPLSTTYVSFMVAMGTSLADRAWGRDSAVYRVSGVLSVIGGWFATAVIAFTAAGLFALIIASFGTVGAILLALLAVAALVHSRGVHKRRAEAAGQLSLAGLSEGAAIERVRERMAAQIVRLNDCLAASLMTIGGHDRAALKASKRHINALRLATAGVEQRLVGEIKRARLTDARVAAHMLRLLDAERALLHSARSIHSAVKQFIRNEHCEIARGTARALAATAEVMGLALASVHRVAAGEAAAADSSLEDAARCVERLLHVQLADLQSRDRSPRNMALQLDVSLGCRDVVAALGVLERELSSRPAS